MTVPQPAASNADSEDGSFPAWSLSALRARHLLGLGLVALLAVISAWTAARAGDLRDGGAHLVNVAGRQRMLSQNIAATALASTCLTRPNDENGPSAVERTELDRLTSEFRAGHEEVMASWPAFGTAEGDEREAASLDAEVVAFLGAVTQFRRGLESGGATVQDAAALRLSSQAFLDRMDRFVGLCEERIDRQVNRSQRPHALALVATLAAILGVYGLILYPTEVRVDRQVRELRDQRRELEAALDKAAAASQVKSEFLANMSHELRTPLQAVLGYADVAATAAAESRPEDAAASWAVVRRNGRHLLRLINNVLDLSKVEAGRINLERFPIAPGPLLREMIATLRPRAAEGVRLSIEIDPEMPAAIATDPTRLRQVLLNLVANAVKFTAKG
ncbi:MAG: histidine kinase dimerization/phospho-acceptor domain-containing protein, partial [Planctomycetota bacterium]